MSGEGKSSGPSSDDTSLSHPFSSGGGGPSSQPIYDVANALPTGSGPPNQGTGAAAFNGGTAAPVFGISTPFSADTTATSGVGQGNSNPASIFSTIGNPSGASPNFSGSGSSGGSVFDTGAQPVSNFGGVGAVPSGPTSPTAGSPVSAAGAGVPAGVNPAVAPDPTQQQKQQNGQPLPPGGGTGGFSLDSLLSSAGKSISSNPLGVVGAAGMAYNAYQANQAMKNIPSIGDTSQAIQAQASQLNAQGKELASYLQSGNLPPGLKAGLDEATSAAKARVIQNFANQGGNTDPTKNSALAAQLAAIDQQAIITTAQIGQQLLGSGIQESGMASSLYNTLAQIDQTQTQRIGQSIANFAAALSPSKGFTLNLAK